MHYYLEEAVRSNGDNIYLKTVSNAFSYKKVYKKSISFHKLLLKNGLQKQDRVVIYSSKNTATIAIMFACSMCEAVYIPVSSLNPSLRAAFIIQETTARFIVCTESDYMKLHVAGLNMSFIQSLDELNLYEYSSEQEIEMPSGDAAFILFTSGSTGTPKGVVVSHIAAHAFIDWAADEFDISDKDTLASIAPFNFDLSVFDIYASAKKGATLVLYTEEETKNALLMAQKISLDKITTIYATPTFYSTLALYGKLQKYDYSSLKNVLFAGEVFHLENFNALLEHWPDKNYANLYGPTETNVCTSFKVDLSQFDYDVFPIGTPCIYVSMILMDEAGNEIKVNNVTAELLIAGQSLFNEYWKDPLKTEASIFTDNSGKKYYKTGDLVYKKNDNNFVYVGRKDRMIKKNGFRIEPLEIESVLLKYPGVSNVVVCFSKEKNQLCCFLECSIEQEQDDIELKKFCQKHLPAYMIPDKFVLLHTMPKTSSGKVDLQMLNNQI